MLRTYKQQQSIWVCENLPQGYLVLEKWGMVVDSKHEEKIVLAKKTEAPHVRQVSINVLTKYRESTMNNTLDSPCVRASSMDILASRETDSYQHIHNMHVAYCRGINAKRGRETEQTDHMHHANALRRLR